MKFDPNLKHLTVFLAVAKHLSYRKAAEELGISQPVLSRDILTLEEGLGFTVFARTTRVVKLTEAGNVLFENISKAYDQIAFGIRAATLTASGHAGTLAVGYTALATHGRMSELLVQFNTNEPQVKLELHLRSSAEQLNDLTSGRLDCGFLMSAACGDAYESIKVHDERIVALVSRAHPLSGREFVSLNELKNDGFVFGHEKRWSTFRSVASAICLQAGFLPNTAEEADEFSILLRHVALGKGITLYAASVREVLPPDIIALKITDPGATFGVSLAWRSGAISRSLKRFIDFCTDNAAERHEPPLR